MCGDSKTLNTVYVNDIMTLCLRPKPDEKITRNKTNKKSIVRNIQLLK